MLPTVFSAIAAHDLVRLCALIEVGATVLLVLVAMPPAVYRWRKATRRSQVLVARLALGRMFTLAVLLLWGSGLFFGVLDRWGQAVMWREALYIAGCPFVVAAWALVDRQHWMSIDG